MSALATAMPSPNPQSRVGHLGRLWLQSLWLLVAVIACDVAMAESTAHVPHVGYIGFTPKPQAVSVQEFLAGMKEHGYVDGRDYIFEYRLNSGAPRRNSRS